MQEPQDLQKLEQERERQHEEAQEHKADQQGLRGEDWVEEGRERVTKHETHLRQMTAWCSSQGKTRSAKVRTVDNSNDSPAHPKEPWK